MLELIELKAILRKALNKDLPDGWLFLPRGVDFYSLNQKGAILNIGEDDMSDNGKITLPAVLEYNLKETIETPVLFDVVAGAREFQPIPTDELLLECFNYYNFYDAFLPEPGFKPKISEL